MALSDEETKEILHGINAQIEYRNQDLYKDVAWTINHRNNTCLIYI